MATCFYSSQAEDFIPLPMTEAPDLTLWPWRRHQGPRSVPYFCTAPSRYDSALPSDYSAAAAAAAFSVPRNHRERSIDAIGDGRWKGDRFPAVRNPQEMRKASPFLGHEAAFETQGHQSEIHRLISQHTQQILSIHDLVARKLKQKDRQIVKMEKLNRDLQEKVDFVAMESQIWRDLARDNEAEADSLRSDLRRVLARVGGVDDAESSCGSNDPGTAVAEARGACT